MAVKFVLFILLARFTICISIPSPVSSSPFHQNSKINHDVNPGKHGASVVPCSERYVAKSYFREYESFVDSEFQEFVARKLTVGTGKAFPRLLNLERHLIGEGAHRRLSSSIQFSIQPDLMPASSSQVCEVIIIERLPSGVFADPFELGHLLQRRVFKDASVFGDVNLELPSFRSNRSIVEVHVDSTLIKPSGNDIVQEFKIEMPLHARYPPLEDSGYSEVRFGVPDLLMRCKIHEELPASSCLLTSIASSGSLQLDSVVWSIPAGVKAHAGIVSIVSFTSALLSAISIIAATFHQSSMQSVERLKQS